MALTASDHPPGSSLLVWFPFYDSQHTDVNNGSTTCNTCQKPGHLMAACSASWDTLLVCFFFFFLD